MNNDTLQREHNGGNIAARYDRPAEPSLWVAEFAALIPGGGLVLDLACGSGRHMRMLHSAGFTVHGVDKQLRVAADLAHQPKVSLQTYDLEYDAWPYPAGSFNGIVVCNYLHRPLLPCLSDALRPGGVLIYDTFAVGNERYGRPRNPDFLLRPGELKAVFGMLEVVAFDESEYSGLNPGVRQSIVVRKSPH